jgi:hypothetical protein
MEQVQGLAAAEAQHDVFSGPIDALPGKILRAVLYERDLSVFAEADQFRGVVAEAQEIDRDDRRRVGRQAGVERTKIIRPVGRRYVGQSWVYARMHAGRNEIGAAIRRDDDLWILCRLP